MSVERTGTTAELMDLMPCAVALLRLYGCRNEAEFAELTGNSFRGMVLPDDYRPLSVMTQEISGPLLTGKDVLWIIGTFPSVSVQGRDASCTWRVRRG